MRDEILRVLPNHTLVESKAKKIYIADYSRATNKVRGVELSDTDHSIGSVRLDNDSELPIYFDGFKDNALPKENNDNSPQCEGVVFPTTCQEDDWVLFIECKYPFSIVQAQDPRYEYPKVMIDQIIATVGYFRAKGILEQNRRAHAIISFPNLKEFNSWAISTDQIDQILRFHRILVRATATATIISPKRIKLGMA